MSKGICQVVECDRTVVSKGLCNPHRQAHHHAKHNPEKYRWPRDGETLEAGAICGPINATPAPAPVPAMAPAPAPAPAPVAPAVSTNPAPAGGLTEEQQEVLGQIFGTNNSDPRVDEVLRRIGVLEAGAGARYKIEVVKGAEVVEVDGLNHRMTPYVLELLAAEKLVYMVGPAGSGKTTMAKRCAEALGLDFQMTGAVVQKYELTGFVDANGTYVESAFYRAFKYGGVFLFDELDASAPGAIVAFNSAIENGLWTAPNGELVERHADFRVIASANTIGRGATLDYVGRVPLDQSTIDRFAFVIMDYDFSLTAGITGVEFSGGQGPLRYKTNKPVSDADCSAYFADVVAYGEAAEALGIRHIVSPRAIINGLDMLRRGVKRSVVEGSFVWKGLDKDSIKKIKAHATEARAKAEAEAVTEGE